MWDELGIDPCDDPKAIRRAYAARLKTLDQDRDPAAFERLRAALEGALAHAERAALDARADEDHLSAIEEWVAERQLLLEEEPTGDEVPPSPASPAPGNGATAERAMAIELEAALDARDAAAAMPLYYRAAATGALALHAAAPLLERLFLLSLEAPQLEAEAFCRLARDFCWDKPPPDDQTESEVRTRVLDRLAAEAWYRALVDAAARRAGETRKQARVARLMLGRIGRVRMPRVDRDALKQRLGEWRTHARWLSDRIAPSWISMLEKRARRREIASMLFYTLFLVAMLLNSMRVVLVATSTGELPVWGYPAAALGAVFLLWLLKLQIAQTRLLLARPVIEPSAKPPDHLLVQLRWLERQAEQAVDAMYDARWGSASAGRYSDAKEFFHDAIALARRLDDAATVERLSQRLAAVKAAYRSQF
jgi:hypothetical protein